MTKMKFKDFIQQDIDIDTYNSYDDYGIAFVGPYFLTDLGYSEFDDILDFDVIVDEDYAEIQIPENPRYADRMCSGVKKFLKSAAGYCSCEEYDAWFKN